MSERAPVIPIKASNIPILINDRFFFKSMWQQYMSKQFTYQDVMDIIKLVLWNTPLENAYILW